MGKFSEFFGVLFNAPFLLFSGHFCSSSLNTAHISSFISNFPRTQEYSVTRWHWIGPCISILTNALQKVFLAVVNVAYTYSPRNTSPFLHSLPCTGYLCLNYLSLASYPLPPKMSLYSAEITVFPTYFLLLLCSE